MRKQRKMEYVSPMICMAYTLEIESPILNDSNDKKSMFKVDEAVEIYSDGTEANDDHFINLY